MYMVMHFALGTLGLIYGFRCTPPVAFLLSTVSLLLDFDSACSVVDAAVNGTTLWKDPKYGNWHSVSRCDAYFLGHAQLTHTGLFVLVASASMCIPVRRLVAACRLGVISTNQAFKMLATAMGLHLLLDLVTFAKDCSEPEHLYLWPISYQSFHMNCMIAEPLGLPPQAAWLRAVRLLGEIGVHCLTWWYILSPLRAVNQSLADWIALTALPGYLMEEIAPFLLGIPNGWGNTASLVYMVCMTGWMVNSSPPPSSTEDLEDCNEGKLGDGDEELPHCQPWVHRIYLEACTARTQAWLVVVLGIILWAWLFMSIEKRCLTYRCSIPMLLLATSGSAVPLAWVTTAQLAVHGPRGVAAVYTGCITCIYLLVLLVVNGPEAGSIGQNGHLGFAGIAYMVMMTVLLSVVWSVFAKVLQFVVPGHLVLKWKSFLPDPAATPTWLTLVLIWLVALQARWVSVESLCYRPSGKTNAIYPVMVQAEKLMRLAEADYWMEGGAVLGLLREGRIHRWDIDVDYAVDEQSFARLHQAALNASLMDSLGLAYKPLAVKDRHTPDMPEFILLMKNAEIVAGSPTGYVHLQACKHFRPGLKCDLAHVTSKCPAPTDLAVMLATDYMSVCSGHSNTPSKDKILAAGRLDEHLLSGFVDLGNTIATAAKVVHSPFLSSPAEISKSTGLNAPAWCSSQGAPNPDMVPTCSRFEALMMGDERAYHREWGGCSDEQGRQLADPRWYEHCTFCK